MLKSEMIKIVKNLEFDKPKSVYKKGNIEIFLLRPSVLSSRFKYYDKNKNFQVWLKDGDKKFRPNHLRLLIDLNLRARSRKDLMIDDLDIIKLKEESEFELMFNQLIERNRTK